MNKILFGFMIASCLLMAISCKNGNRENSSKNNEAEVAKSEVVEKGNSAECKEYQISDTSDVMKLYGTASKIMVATHGMPAPAFKPDMQGALSGDAIEHQMANGWPKISIFVENHSESDELDLEAVLSAVASVYPMPMLIDWYNAVIQSRDMDFEYKSKGTFLYEQDNHIIMGEWPGEDYKNNFSMKAWKIEAENIWAIGFVCRRLWDGDDGIGVYQNLMFWTFDSKKDRILRPIVEEETPERFLPVYTNERGYVKFLRDNDNLDFEDGANPELFWKWNGSWFVSSVSQGVG